MKPGELKPLAAVALVMEFVFWILGQLDDSKQQILNMKWLLFQDHQMEAWNLLMETLIKFNRYG